ncbi:MAG: TetR/AcrR family transcriptional regulator [Elusimicrobia bacterium]|nr:TetR/AcrR family transcriptional regulator [Elusimicrobiota bacterium]
MRSRYSEGNTDRMALSAEVMRQARELFSSRGFSSVTMDEVCSAVRISKKTLYAMYPSKEALFDSALSRTLSEIDAESEAIMKQRKLDCFDRVKAILSLVRRSYALLSRPLLEDIRRYAPQAWKKVHECREKELRRLESLVADGVREGLFRPDMNVALGSLLYTELVRAVLSPDFLIKRNYRADEVSAAVFNLFLRAMLTDKGRAAAHARGLV